MAVSDEVRIKIITDTKEAVAGLAQWGAGIGAAIVAVKKVVDTLNEMSQEFFKSEKAEAKLNATLNATGNAIGYTKAQLRDMASEMQRLTVFDDEAATEAEALMLTYDKIGKDIFPRVLAAASDLATVMGGDLKSSAQTLGVALENPTEGMNRLRRAGIVFTDDQKKMVKSLQDSGDMLGAQNVILEALEHRVGGAAKAMGETAFGAAEKLKNEMGNLKEKLGGVIQEAIKPTTVALSDLISQLNAGLDAAKELRSLQGKSEKTPAENLREMELRLDRVTDQIRVIKGTASEMVQTLSDAFNPLGGFGVSGKKETMENEKLNQLMREQFQLSLSIQVEKAKLSKADSEAAAIAKEKADLEEYLLRVSEAYAKTEEGKADTLRTEIALWEEARKSAVLTLPQVDAILKSLKSQLPVNTAIAEESERAARAALDMSAPFQNISQSIQTSDTAALDMSEAFRNISQGILYDFEPAVRRVAVSSEQIADLWGDTSQYVKASVPSLDEVQRYANSAATAVAMTAENAAKASKGFDDMGRAASLASDIFSGMTEMMGGDFLSGIEQIVTAIANVVPGLGAIASSIIDMFEEAFDFNQNSDIGETLASGISNVFADAIENSDFSNVEDALAEKIKGAIIEALLRSSLLKPYIDAFTDALEAWLSTPEWLPGLRQSNYDAMISAYQNLLTAGENAGQLASDLFAGLPGGTAAPPPGDGVPGLPKVPDDLIDNTGTHAPGPNRSVTYIVQGSLIHERDLDSRIYSAVTRKAGGY
jgi:hypothetical protein